MPANEGQNEVNEAKTRLIFLFERASKNEVLVWYIHRPLNTETMNQPVSTQFEKAKISVIYETVNLLKLFFEMNKLCLCIVKLIDGNFKWL